VAAFGTRIAPFQPYPIGLSLASLASSFYETYRPGKPVENAFVESFKGRLRDECLNVYSFESIAMRALGHLTPSECAAQRQARGAEVTDLQFAPV
jgi:hypothetical protein